MNIKLLICDDEKLIREGLASLEWEKHNIEVIGTANNGEIGFEIFNEYKPDIVITDIRMPKRDGIWLSEQINNIAPETKIIFLTGYNEFEYARSAVKNGVCQYLNKPIDESELYDIVDELCKGLIEKRETQKKNDELYRLLNTSRYFLMSFFFNRAASGIIDYSLFGVSPAHNMMTTIVIRIESNERESIASYEIFDKIVKNIPDDISSIPFYCNNELVFINMPYGNLPEAESRVFSYCEQISEFMDSYGCIYNIGIGNFTPNIDELHSSYESAIQALGYSGGLGDRNVIYIADIEPRSQLSAYQTKLLDMYIKSLKNNDTKQIKRDIREIFDCMKRSDMSLYNQQRRCLSLILAISDALYDLDCSPTILFNNTDAWSLIKKTQSTEELRQFIENITDVVIAHIDEVQKQKTANIITKVKELVEKNYADDASLETVASQVYISPCYLSVIFKKETNITFKNYLIQTRINKAKELLETTDMKIYEIAEKVGYTDTRYFSELFQRICGKTPSQYRTRKTIEL